MDGFDVQKTKIVNFTTKDILTTDQSPLHFIHNKKIIQPEPKWRVRWPSLFDK